MRNVGLGKFSKYSGAVLESLGGITILERAMSTKGIEPRQRAHLEDLYSLCNSIGIKAAKRIVLETDTNADSNLEEIAKDAELNDEENEEVEDGARELDLDNVAQQIKDKVISTINNEKDAYAQEQDLQEEVKDKLDLDGFNEKYSKKKDSDDDSSDEEEDDKSDDSEEDESDEDSDDEDAGDEDKEDGDSEDDSEEDSDKEDKKSKDDKDEDDETEEEDEDSEASSDDSEDEDDSGDEKGKDKDKKDTKEDEDDDKDKKKDSAKESYFDIFLGRTYHGNHVSLFSKIQRQVLESLRFTTEKYKEIPFKTLTNVTLDRTLNVFNRDPKDVALEVVSLYSTKAKKISKKKMRDMVETATVGATIIYTALETLNTMGLYRPTKASIRECVDGRDRIEGYIQNNSEKAIDFSIVGFDALVDKARDPEFLKKVICDIEKFKEDGNVPECKKKEVCDILDKANAKLGQFGRVESPRGELTSFEKRDKEDFVGKLNRVFNSLCANGSVKEIRLVLDKDNPNFTNIDVISVGQDGRELGKRPLQVKYRAAFGSYENHVKESFNACKHANTDKKVVISSPTYGRTQYRIELN
jgi:hypothetical protein